jgi:uncharacterized protein YkwD
MQITFREFIELAEGKKKKAKIERLKSAYLAGQEQAPRQIKNYGGITAPNSAAREDQIAAMMADSGGREVRKAKEKREREAKRAAKNILKQQQEGFSVKKTQKELEKQREDAKKRRQQEAEQRNNAARNAFRREGGMISYEKDPETGKVVRGRRTKDGFTPDT